MAGAGSAQAQPGAAGSYAPGSQVRRQLETLAENPNSVQALIDAGRLALDMGDGAAALGFYTRASQLAGGNPRVKLGLAAAHARNGRPQNAIMLFSQAQAMGIPLGEIAGERGLAYDLMGQPAMAQQDYVAALRYREDPEVRRRLALSLAISGQREAALRVIAPQVQRGDRGGLRTRALVLALSGDAAGATEAARTSMPPGSSQAMAPFFQRIAALTPGQMAAAAHLGRFPSNGGFRMAGTTRPASDPGALAFAGGGTVPSIVTPGATRTVRAFEVPSAGSRRRSRNGDGQDRSRRSVSSETRSLASSTGSARATDEARRTVERWDRASGDRRQTSTAAAPQQLASRPVAVAPQIAAAASPAPAAEAVTSQSLASAVPGPSAIPQRQPQPPVVTSSQLLQPHPYEPLRLGGGGAAAGGATEPVQLGSSARAALPIAGPAAPLVEASPSASAAPMVQAAAAPAVAAQSAVPADAAANLAAWNLAGSNASPAGNAPPAGTAPAADVTPVASANLVTEVAGAAPVTPAATAAAPADAAPRTGPAFADVIATVSSLSAETEATPVRSVEPAPARTARPRASRNEAAAATRETSRASNREAASASASASRASRAESTRGSSPRPTTERAERGSASSARTAAAQTPARTRQPAHPTRIWVQVATAARDSLPAEFSRLRRKAPELLRSRTGYTAPIGASGRLLVGPFETAAEARTFVNRLKEEEISSYPWTSDSGQQVDRLPAGR